MSLPKIQTNTKLLSWKGLWMVKYETSTNWISSNPADQE